MNEELNYENQLERKNTSNKISGVLPEEANELNTLKMIL